MAERKRRRLTNRMQDGCAYVQSETGKEGVGHYTTQRRLPELITFTCKVEDIMEKYGIESVEELDDFFANYKVSSFLTEDRIKEIAVNEQRKVFQSMIKEITEKECNQLYTELNAWKRACELACAFLAGITQDNVCDYEDYFYQQAKNKDLEEC